MKRKINKCLLFGCTLLISVACYAQKRKIIDRPAPFIKSIPDLKVGDELPDFKIEKMINGVKRSMQTAEFRDRLLILDFWDTACGSCIAAMPKMGRLQQIFGSKVSILAVTWEEEQKIREFWKQNSYTRDVKLPGVVEDSVLHSYFRHRYVPHEIWVYKGKVIGITDGEHVDEKNIRAVLEGGKPSLPLKYDYYLAYDQSKPVFSINPGQLDQKNTPLRYAAIRGYRPGLFASGWTSGMDIVRDSVNRTVRAYFLNAPIWMAYFMYLQNTYKRAGLLTPDMLPKPNGTLWEVADRGRYRYKIRDEAKAQGYTQDWMIDNSICFEGWYPDKGQSDEQVYAAVIQDMNRLLGLNVRLERRREKVYVIIDLNQGGSVSQKKTQEIKGGVNLYELEDHWNNQEDYPYLFEESKKEGKYKSIIKMNIDTTGMLGRILELKSQLAVYGLELREEERLVDRIVFSEVEGGLLLDGRAMAAAKAEKEAQQAMPGPTAEQGRAFLEANKSKPGVVVLPSGLQYKILKKGNGPVADSSSRVTVRYKGTLVNGKVFDSSALQGRVLTFGVKEVIPGWTEALQLMEQGSKWMLYVPSELAYGTHSNSGQLPPSSVLVFEMEVLKVMK